MKLNIAEIFTSIQGEGHLVGNRTHFIRFAGCTVSVCPLHPSQSGLCDTNWNPMQTIKSAEAIKRLAGYALSRVGINGWVSITGGEPADQPEAMRLLASEIIRRGMQLNIQTSGTKKIDCPWDWLTVSPKGKRADMRQDYGQELKIIYNGQSLDELREWYDTTKFEIYYLQPLWSGDDCNKQETIRAVHDACKSGMEFRLSMQMHKWANIR